jgi:hypothetical protein
MMVIIGATMTAADAAPAKSAANLSPKFFVFHFSFLFFDAIVSMTSFAIADDANLVLSMERALASARGVSTPID